MCVKQWLIANTNKNKKRTLEADNVFRVMRSVTKYYLMLKTYLQM